MAQVPLHEHHVSLGAKFGPFGAWEMPIEYATGTLVEHNAVRNNVGVFDVSHMGKVRVLGHGAKDYVNSLFTNDLNRIGAGQAQYSMLCNETGGIIDDLIVYLVSEDEVRIIPNASNAHSVVEVLREYAPTSVIVEDLHLLQGIIAVQGPKSAELIALLDLPSSMDYMQFQDVIWQNQPVSVCRTGYTGEHGYELVAANEAIISIWEQLLNNGKAFGLVACGLGARDTLRTEMGYVLHGQDISESISPIQARTSWAVGWSKPVFVGKSALDAQKTVGPPNLAWGLLALDRGIPRAHMSVTNGDGDVVGETTSGTFSPTLQKGIALALLDTAYGEGDVLNVDVRGRSLRVEVVRPPFVPSSPK